MQIMATNKKYAVAAAPPVALPDPVGADWFNNYDGSLDGPAIQISSDGMVRSHAIARISSTEFLITYREGSTPNHIVELYTIGTGSPITKPVLQDRLTLSDGRSGEPQIYVLDSTRAILNSPAISTDSTPTNIARIISISAGSPRLAANAATAYSPSQTQEDREAPLVPISASKSIVSFKNGSSGRQARVLDHAGTTITTNTAITMATNNLIQGDGIRVNSNQVVMSFRNLTGTQAMYTYLLEENGSSGVRVKSSHTTGSTTNLLGMSCAGLPDFTNEFTQFYVAGVNNSTTDPAVTPVNLTGSPNTVNVGSLVDVTSVISGNYSMGVVGTSDEYAFQLIHDQVGNDTRLAIYSFTGNTYDSTFTEDIVSENDATGVVGRTDICWLDNTTLVAAYNGGTNVTYHGGPLDLKVLKI